MMKTKSYYIKYDLPEKISDKNLQKIINFYLLNCPVPKVSWRGKSFPDYGFSDSAPFGKLLSAMKAIATESFKLHYYPSKSKKELQNNFIKIENIGPPDEYCVFLNNKNNNMFSLFYAIRCALAHGSFNVKSYNGVRIYFFVNFDKYRKAQIVLQEKTLLAWIDLVQAGYDALK